MTSDPPYDILEHFRKVRDDTGISISLQMKMHKKGYKIVKFGEYGNKMVEINDE